MGRLAVSVRDLSAYPPATGTGGLQRRTPVSPLFWMAAGLAAGIGLAGPVLDPDLVATGCLYVMLIGGLPHGAFDIATGKRLLDLKNARVLLLLISYIGIALAMAGLWSWAPVFALALFLASAALHFSEDWQSLDTGLLRATAGASIICIPAIFQPRDVDALFIIMAGEDARLLTRLAVAIAPVAILVMFAAVLRTFMLGDRAWALAQATAFAGLALLPPALGFTVYFVFLHSPLHIRAICSALPEWSQKQLVCYAAAMVGIALFCGSILLEGLLSDTPALALASGFKLLSILAAPHLLLHGLSEKLLANWAAKTDPSPGAPAI